MRGRSSGGGAAKAKQRKEAAERKSRTPTPDGEAGTSGDATQDELKRVRGEMFNQLEERKKAKSTWGKGKDVVKQTDAAAAKVGGGKHLSTMEQANLTAGILAGDRKIEQSASQVNRHAVNNAGLAGGGNILLASKAAKWKSKSPARSANDAAVEEMGKMADKMKKISQYRPPTKDEVRWDYITKFLFFLDLPILAYFFYQAFLLHADDRKMDPLGWRLAFGGVMVFIVFQIIIIKLDAMKWFSLWMTFTAFLTLGHFYGACRYFFWIYNLPFPCFRGQEAEGELFNMCYEGKLLVGTSTAAAYLVFQAFVLWRWCAWRRETILKEGKPIDDMSMDELLAQVDDKIEVQRRREEENIAAAAAAAAESGRIVGVPRRNRGARAGTVSTPDAREGEGAGLGPQMLPLPPSMQSPHGSSVAGGSMMLSPRPPELSFDRSMLFAQPQHASFPALAGTGTATAPPPAAGGLAPPPMGGFPMLGMGHEHSPEGVDRPKGSGVIPIPSVGPSSDRPASHMR